MSVGMTVTPALAEEATPEAAAPAETVAVNAPTFYANSHDVKAVVMNIGAAQDSVNVTWYGSTPTGGMLKYGVQGGEMTTLQAAVAPTSSEGWYKNTVTLTGLQSNTTYEYAVSADKDEAITAKPKPTPPRPLEKMSHTPSWYSATRRSAAVAALTMTTAAGPTP